MGKSAKDRKWERRRELYERRGQPPVWFWNIWQRLTKQLIDEIGLENLLKEIDKIVEKFTLTP